MAPKKKEEPKPAAAPPPKPPEPERPKTPEFDPTTVTVNQSKNSNVKQCRETKSAVNRDGLECFNLWIEQWLLTLEIKLKIEIIAFLFILQLDYY